jgi:hypothetical protein
MDINENPFKIMYLFIKDICHKRTNCGAGCPWGLRVRDDSFDG